MYIKQITIQGFRSYRDQVVVDPFSSRHNVIVGRNGSGKSNFFYAIQFVLSDEFSHLRADQRQALLHEGSGPRVLQASVEIKFDNSDNRLPFDKDDVCLKRLVGAKKDQYYLDGKVVTKTDVVNLLESAGFSRSNPYYIVKQGKINELAVAPDSYRLKLLREVAGTKVYDDRKEESKEILQDTENKRSKIEELLKYIEERLRTLENEKEELKSYQKWDKMRRSIEYTIYDHELRDTRRKLDELHQRRENFNNESSGSYDEQQELTQKLTALEREIRDLERSWSGLEDERQQLNTEQSETFKKKTQYDLNVRDLKEEVDGERSSQSKAEDDLNSLNSLIAKKDEKLKLIGPQYSELVRLEQETITQLAIADQRRNELYTKQGWTHQFSSAEMRDQWIKKQIAKLERQITEKNEQISKLKNEEDQEEGRLSQVENKIADSNSKLEEERQSIERAKQSQTQTKHKRDRLQAERTELWREESNLNAVIQNLKDELSHVQMGLRATIGRSIVSGIDGVNRILQSFREKGSHRWVVDGYHGLLMEIFSAEQLVFTAIEVSAGNRLFYHVVSNDNVALKIMEEFNRLKLPGEVNFLPMNRLDGRRPEVEKNENVIPIIEKLCYQPEFETVMNHVFGRILLCRNIEYATSLARALHMDCVTVDGEQVGNKGAITGGWYDNQRNRLQYQYKKMEILNKINETETQVTSQRSRLNEIESQILQTVSELQKFETVLVQKRDVYERLQVDNRSAREERHMLLQSKSPKQLQLANFESTLAQLTAQRDHHNKELGTALLSQLTTDEQSELDELTKKIDDLTKRSKATLKQRAQLDIEKNQLENELQTNLLRKRDELQTKLQEITVEDRRHLLETNQSELRVVNRRILDISHRLAELEKQLEGYYKDKEAKMKALEQLQTREREVSNKINEELKEMEKLASKQSVLTKKMEDCSNKIRDLGTLPADAFEKYQNLGTKQLFKKLEESKRELKKYENVNKKALDQFISFSEQKEKLVKRKEELDRAHQSIIDLIETLDQRKYDAIQLTFKQVSTYFQEVFAKLVLGGKAQLEMKYEEDPRDSTPKPRHISGISIKVSFSGTDETREMQQLSGGQKSLVALALIFAIQKCDPAPFYLFDEIDAAMDPQYRKAVADMMQSLCQNAQFITTTFRPELLETADQFYGVRFRDKISHIDRIEKAEAANFVEDDATHR